jgi:hypothetical protein
VTYETHARVARPLPPLNPAANPVLSYASPAPAAIGRWQSVAGFATAAEWHHARARLTRAGIDAQMGQSPGMSDCLLLVPEADAERAFVMLQFSTQVRYCPRCGSSQLTQTRMPWLWMLCSIPFLGVAPFDPPRWACRNCGKRIK